MNKEQKEHLLAAAALVEHSETFNMQYYGHDCGTPACVLGHATRIPGAPFALGVDGELVCRDTGALIWIDDRIVRDFFGVTKFGAYALFGTYGCGEAGTDGAKAAKYIRDFVAREEAGL